MSKVITSVKSTAIDALDAKARRMLASAVAAGNAIETVAASKVHRAVTTSHTLKVMTGLSGNAVAELVAVAGGASRATTHRLIAVGDVLARDTFAAFGTDAAVEISGALYYVFGRGKAVGGGKDALVAYADMVEAGKSTAVDAVEAARALAKLVKDAEAVPTVAPRRPVAGEAADGGKLTAPAEAEAPAEAAPAPAAAGLASLLAAVEDRLAARAATVTEADVEAVERIAARVAELVENGKLATSRKRSK